VLRQFSCSPEGTDKATDATANANLEQIKKEHPLAAILQFNTSGQGRLLVMHTTKIQPKSTNYFAMQAVLNDFPKELRLKWGVSAAEFDPKAQTFELYAIKSTERNGKAPLEGDVVNDAKDEYDQWGKPAVSMEMNTDGARRWLC
jgi:SecD/SecF fusion protein